MDLASLFVKRPVMTTLLMLAIIISGAIAFRSLPVAALPSVDFPTITVSASLPGANPQTMASTVATPLERQFSTIPGLSSMTSSNLFGSSQITLQFEVDRNIDAAAQDVQTAISAATRLLPVSMPSPPIYRKVNPADQPILFLVVSSESLPLYKVNDYAETLVAQRLSMVEGVAQVQVIGSQKYAVRAQLNPDLLAARELGLDDVTNAISTGNVNLPTGTLYGHEKAVSVDSSGQLINAEQYKPLVVAYRNGYPVRLGDLGDVIDSVENDKSASWLNGKRAILLAVLRQPGTNTVGIVDRVKQVLPDLRKQIPGAVYVEVLYDRSESIRQSVHDVELTLVSAVFLVVGVIYLFLQNRSATLIPSLALPTSIIGTFGVMYLWGFSLNNLTLMALTLSVGFVVDDAIVVVENIVRHLEMGASPFEAAIAGTREIWFTVVSMTLSLVAVFIPVLFMGGIIGKVFREFAITTSAAILISGVVALTLTPMLCSRWLRRRDTAQKYSKTNFFEGIWNVTTTFYDRTLLLTLRHQKAVLLILLFLIGATGYLFTTIPKGFLPEEDTGQLRVSTEGAQDISYDSMVKHQELLAAIVQQNPNVQAVMSSVAGVGGGMEAQAMNQGRMFVTLKERPLRRDSAQEVIEQLRKKLRQVPGIKCYLKLPPTISIGSKGGKSLYQVTLQSSDTASLYSSADALLKELRDSRGFQDVNGDVLNNAVQVNVEVNRDLASSLNITQQMVEEALASAYGRKQISTIYGSSDQYRVIVELQPQYQLDSEALSKLYIHVNNGRAVPLRSVATLSETVAPLMVNHQGQFPAATISFNLTPGFSLGDAVKHIDVVAPKLVHSDVSLSFQGQAQAFQSTLNNLSALLILAAVIIYIVLGILYESFIHPITILSGLPAAGFGALVTLSALSMSLDVYGYLGLILLVGIVKKNAIMMVDFAVQRQASPCSSAERAIYEACLIRFRPIMMTTAAALVGTLPIALGLGAGAEARQPLGLAVFGGLLVSQLLTLYITPVVYIELDRIKLRLSQKNRLQMAIDANVGRTETDLNQECFPLTKDTR